MSLSDKQDEICENCYGFYTKDVKKAVKELIERMGTPVLPKDYDELENYFAYFMREIKQIFGEELVEDKLKHRKQDDKYFKKIQEVQE